jgi:hypothetical protein
LTPQEHGDKMFAPFSPSRPAPAPYSR